MMSSTSTASVNSHTTSTTSSWETLQNPAAARKNENLQTNMTKTQSWEKNPAPARKTNNMGQKLQNLVHAATRKTQKKQQTKRLSNDSAHSGVSSVDSSEVGSRIFFQHEGTNRKEYRALSNAAVLKAFRLIGSVDGVKEKQLRLALTKLPNRPVRTEVLSKLHIIFAKHDVRRTGSLDVFEFDQMIGNSALLEKAIYELMEAMSHEVVAEDDLDSMWDTQLEYASALVVLLNFLVMAIATDNDPDWLGWQVVELVFVILFAMDISLRFKRARTLRAYVSNPMNVFDVLITTVVAIDVVVSLSLSKSSWGALGLFRIVRLARLARVVKVICSCKELITVVQTLVTNFRSFAWTFVLLGLALFLWAVIVRQSLLFGWMEDESGALHVAFSSVPECMFWMFRCWVLSPENSCAAADGTPVFDHFSPAFQVTWVVIELFVCLGVLNVLAATFVLNMTKADKKIDEEIAATPATHTTKVTLVKRLDKLLRVLTHPHRKLVSPKDRNVAKVATYIHDKHPDCAEKMTDMSKTLVDFAETIQESQALLANALSQYEASEHEVFQELLGLPTAKMYFFEGAERLMVNDCGDLGRVAASMGLSIMPDGAIEVQLVQESHDLEELLKDAQEVQQLVKSKIQVGSSKGQIPGQLVTMFGSRSSGGDAFLTADEVVDPGPKSRGRIREKVEFKYKGRYERNRDYARMGLLFDSVEGLLRSLKAMLNSTLAEKHGIQVVSVENRFVEPSPLGWRDVSVLLKVRSPSSGRSHVMEVQLNLRGLNEVRGLQHKFYEKIRAVLPEEAVSVVIDKLTNNTTLDLDISQQEWLECLKNTEVSLILDQLKIPYVIRRDAIEILDSDGSGKVSTHELRDGLLQCSEDLGLSGGVVDCKLKVKEIQQWLRNQMEPQVQLVQDMLRSFERNQRDENRDVKNELKSIQGQVLKSLVQVLPSDVRSMGPTPRRFNRAQSDGVEEITDHAEMHNQHASSSCPPGNFGSIPENSSKETSLSASKVSPEPSKERDCMESEALSCLSPRVDSVAIPIIAPTMDFYNGFSDSVGNDVAGMSPLMSPRQQELQYWQQLHAQQLLQAEQATLQIQSLTPRRAKTAL